MRKPGYYWVKVNSFWDVYYWDGYWTDIPDHNYPQEIDEREIVREPEQSTEKRKDYYSNMVNSGFGISTTFGETGNSFVKE